MKTFEDFLKKHPEIKYTESNVNNTKNNIKSTENNTNNAKNNVKSEDGSIQNIEGNINNTSSNNQKSHKNIKLEQANNKQEYENIQEFDKAKTKVLKYVLYKKRTEQEIKQKFSSELNENLLEDIIQNLKENGYISDTNYIQRAVNEFIAIKTLSIKEIYIKLYAKGISSNTIDEYFNENEKMLEQYEISCAKKIIIKKSSQMEKEEIENYLYKKGYKSENIKTAFEELENQTEEI